MATHSSVLAWRIPGMGEPGGLPSMGTHRVGHDCRDSAAGAAAAVYFKTINVSNEIILSLDKSFSQKCRKVKMDQNLQCLKTHWYT